MLPLREWPTRLWVAAIAAAALLIHAAALVIHLAVSGPTEDYGIHVGIGLSFFAVVLFLGLFASIPAARDADPRVARIGQVLVAVLAGDALAMVALTIPTLGIT